MSLLTILIAGLACDRKAPERDARGKLASMLRDSIGRTTDPKVAFIVHGTALDRNLYVHFDTTAFANLSDSAFVVRAKEIARFSVRHYDKAQNLDSVTVASRETLEPGVARIHHQLTFSMTALR